MRNKGKKDRGRLKNRSIWIGETLAVAVPTFAPTAFPRLMAFLSLCWPPEDGESAGLEPRLGLTDAGERRAEVWPGLMV